MTTHTPQQQPVDAEVQKHVDELLKLGWQFKGRGLYPTWGRGEHIHHRFSSKTQTTTND
jgi:hypothetical protein